MQIIRIVQVLTFSLCLGLGVAACEKHEPGPAEKAGQKVDAAAHDMKNAAEDAKKDVDKAVDDAKKEVEKE